MFDFQIEILSASYINLKPYSGNTYLIISKHSFEVSETIF